MRSIMNGDELHKVLEHVNRHHCNKFNVGIFAADTLPHKVKRPAAFIANTDIQSQQGTHWIAFFFPRRGKFEYFDSYGLPPIIEDHLTFLSKKKTFLTNEMELQDVSSTFCGHYCLLFLSARMNDTTMKGFQRLFSTNTILNDEIVNRSSNQLFKHVNMEYCTRGQQCVSKNDSYQSHHH
jgi:hypothetical protein